MKKIYLLSYLIVAGMICAQAQDYKSVKVGFGLGYASPGGEGAKGGVLLYFEPAYRVNDAIAVGLRIEGAVMARGVVATVGGITAASEAEISANASYSVNGQYYFLNGPFRPFAGLGLGLFSLASTSVSVSGTGTSVSASAASSKFGFYPRFGFDLGHFVMQIEYNIIPTTSSEVTVTIDAVPTVVSSESKNSYLGIKAGFFIGGGKK